MTFEVGKKYTNDHNTIYECKYVGRNHSFLESSDPSDLAITALPSNHMLEDPKCHWREFKEPVVEKKRKGLFLDQAYNGGFGVFDSKSVNLKPTATIEFTFTDGELTGVEIVK